MQPCPLAIVVPAGHLGDTPAWLARQAVTRFREQLSEVQDDLGSARLSLRRMIRTENPGPL